jgi:hypothetical protein
MGMVALSAAARIQVDIAPLMIADRLDSLPAAVYGVSRGRSDPLRSSAL